MCVTVICLKRHIITNFLKQFPIQFNIFVGTDLAIKVTSVIEDNFFVMKTAMI